MENPTFHLEGIVKNKNVMDDFEGPLNLILMLLTKNKIEIRDIQISLILEQYLEQISHMQELNLEIASEFVQMASHLLYIKTKMLLVTDKEVTELEQLIADLETLKCKDAYLKVKEVVPELAKSSEQGLLMFSTLGETLPQYGEYNICHTPAELLQALAMALSHGSKDATEEQAQLFVPQPIVYGVREKGRELIDWLREGGECALHLMYEKCKSRSELVATFIAVLELCSSGSVSISHSDEGYVIALTGADVEAVLENISD